MDITMTRRGLNRATLDRQLLLGRSPQHPVEAIEHLVGPQAQAVERTALRRPAADLAARFPDLDAAALAYACRCRLPLVQAPPRGVWGKASRLALAPLDGWLGRPLSAAPSLDDVVLRYLGAFGPATAADVATWSRLTGIREVLDRLRPRLLAVRDPAGRQLLDLPEALCPHPDTPAPVRFLPEYDNVVLSHSDRARLRSDDHERLAGAAGPIKGSVLVDGRVGAIWHAEAGRDRRYVSLVVEHLRLDQRETQALEAEAERVVHFFTPTPATLTSDSWRCPEPLWFEPRILMRPESALVLRPIGWVESPLVDRAAAPKQGDEGAPDAWLVVDPAYADGLRDVVAGTDMLVLTWLDRARRDVLVVHPRDDPATPRRGVFSTRSADRPNPIGLHRVHVVAVAGLRLRVRDLEALDGTPVLDVKPVLGPVEER